MRFLTPAEIARLADAIRPSYRALVLVGAYGGLRIGELAGLRRSRVDLLRGTVEVAEIVTEVGGRLHGATQDPRQPPHRRATARCREEAGRPPGSASRARCVGVHRPEGRAAAGHRLSRSHLGPATRNAGLDGLRIHDLRHTAVALWVAAGANPKEVAVRAGHTSVCFTLDRYGHLYPESDAALRDRLDAIYSAS